MGRIMKVLAIAALRASFTWAFLAVCILVLIFLVVFGFCVRGMVYLLKNYF